MPWRKRENAIDHGHRFADGAEKQVRGNRGVRKLRRNAAAGKERAHFGCKQQAATPDRVVERLDAQRIAREENCGCGAAATLGHFDDGEREHAAQSGDGLFTPLLVGVDDYFSVGAGEERVALGFEFLAQLAKIVNFSVEDDRERAGFIPDGLRAAGKIDDAKAPRADDDWWGGEKSFFIRAAMDNRREHTAYDGLTV